MLAMVRKEILVLLRDRASLITLFISPVLFMTVMSFALGNSFHSLGSPGKLSISIVDEDHSAAAQGVVKALSSSGELQVTSALGGVPLSAAQAQSRVHSQTDAFTVVLPAGFQQQVAGGGAPKVDFVVDPSSSRQVVDPVESAISSLIVTVTSQEGTTLALTKLGDAQSDPGVKAAIQAQVAALDSTTHQVDSTVSFPNGEGAKKYPSVYQQEVPGYTVMYVFFIVTIMAGSIMVERREGTFRRLLSAPMPRWQLLLGKVAPYLLVAVVQVGILLSFGRFVFGMSLGAHPLALLPISLALASCAVALGLLLASVARSESQVMGMGTAAVLVLAALGGCMVPGVFMPQFMQHITHFIPQGIALNAYQDVLVRGESMTAILPGAGILLAVAVGMFALALPRFRFVR
ncbi:ABC-2 type transport system permease protein [Kitasatospora sp. MAA4]|uniref:ABC transporter permease n=1 Tax=Kitasatospora sp. MAA4 TaxID=3035093 RepID=UPI002473E77F|nr:ABC transporter permease [Kitasatospora sp. MAA4]MDH6135327.1 ABC-2 type transport system permease protein [Kitasatospora sp. MAA4]